eukprot:6828125-Ditylum_brightwellii.AAC.1
MKGGSAISTAPPQQQRASFVAKPCAGEITCGNVSPALRQKLAVQPNVINKTRMKRGSWMLRHWSLCCVVVLIKMEKLDALPHH